MDRSWFILRNGLLRFTDQTIDQIFVSEPYFAYIKSTQSNLSLDMSKLLNTKKYVWIEMTTSNSYVRGLYNGWFHHNETHSCLINEKGLTLPYEGLGISFHAYPNRKMCWNMLLTSWLSNQWSEIIERQPYLFYNSLLSPHTLIGSMSFLFTFLLFGVILCVLHHIVNRRLIWSN